MEATSKKVTESLRRLSRIAAVAVVVSSLASSMALANQGNGNGGGNPNTTTTSSTSSTTSTSTTSTTSTTVPRNAFFSPIMVDNQASSGCTSNEPAWVINARSDLWHLVVSNGTTTVTVEEIMAGTATVAFGSTTLPASFIPEFSSNQDGVAKHIYLRTNPTRQIGESMPTSFVLTWSGGKSIGKTVFSHFCLLRDQVPPPVIDVISAVPTYDESYTQSHAWTVAKSLNLADGEDPVVKWFSKGDKPEYKVSGLRAAATTDAGSYRVGSAQVTGTFSLQDAVLADASIKLVAASGSGLSDVDCAVSGSASPYSYTCTLVGLDGFANSSGNLLSGKGFTISGSVKNGNTDPLGGSFSSAVSSAVRSTSGVTATLTDDLADLDGSACSTDSGVCSVSGGSLTVANITGDFTVTYTGGWDYTNYYTSTPFDAVSTKGACEATRTNTATLTPAGQSDKTVTFGLTPKCPTPTVSLGSVTAEHSLSYTDTYSWSVVKSLGTVDETTKKAPYTVTATRSGPVTTGVSGSSVTISGGFSTTFAPSTNVSVNVTAVGDTTLSTKIPCTVNADKESYSCTVPASTPGLTTLTAADKDSGWSGTPFTVEATVATGGGSNTATRNDGTVGTPGEPNITKVNASAYVTDDLDSGKYSASDIICAAGSENCWTGSSTVEKGSSIQTASSENEIVLTYNMNWLPEVKLTDECPTITNKAEVFSDSASLDSDTQSDQMTCPQLTMAITSSVPQYNQQSDNSYNWTLVKTTLPSDPITWQPRYQVVATRGAAVPVPNSWRIVDGTQKVTGVMTVVLNPATSVITPAQVEASLKLDGTTDCSIVATSTAGQFDFSCTKVTEDSVSSANGLKDKPYVLTWSGSAYRKSPSCAPTSATECSTTDTKWSDATRSVPGNDVNASASIVDSNVITGTTSGYSAAGIIVNGSQSAPSVLTSTSTTTTITMTYALDWKFNNGAGCGQSITNTASLRNDKNETIIPSAGSILSRTVVVNCGRSEPGLTIGFYGNKQGGQQVVANRTNWRTASSGNNWTSPAPQWHIVLGVLPNFNSDSAVRDYMNAANCNSNGVNSGGKTCQTMFRAQALASVMNAIKSQAFAEQSVMFGGSCTKVRDLFTAALASTTIDAGTTPALIASRIAYKSIFDDLNNSRAVRCPNS